MFEITLDTKQDYFFAGTICNTICVVQRKFEAHISRSFYPKCIRLLQMLAWAVLAVICYTATTRWEI